MKFSDDFGIYNFVFISVGRFELHLLWMKARLLLIRCFYPPSTARWATRRPAAVAWWVFCSTGSQRISLIIEAIVHYVPQMTPKTSHNPWVRFAPPCCSGALIFISPCPFFPTSNALSHFFVAHFLLIHNHLPQHLVDRRDRTEKRLFLHLFL